MLPWYCPTGHNSHADKLLGDDNGDVNCPGAHLIHAVMPVAL